ncbi:MAG TPA: hypothetical protein VK548_06905 [Candidatus Acidoferrum sp.]|nr:hypothetical protein [Candidatus Acidoferrum sp.]
MDQELRDHLLRSFEEFREMILSEIRADTAKTCRHIDEFAERLKPGKFLRYLEARVASGGDSVRRGGPR